MEVFVVVFVPVLANGQGRLIRQTLGAFSKMAYKVKDFGGTLKANLQTMYPLELFPLSSHA